jgi:proline iminopeptidase
MMALAGRAVHAFQPGFGYYPPVKPYESGHLKVSDLHEIYYEISGNPKGIPVIYLHGGPGTGFSDNMRQAFAPKVFKLVLYDQRGCGRSRPQYELKENTTADLVDDIEKLRLHLGLGRVMIVGGSWGATLGIAYAEKYPDNISAMVLRAIFMGTKKEDDHIYARMGVEKFFPEVFEKISTEVSPGAKELDRKKLMGLLTSRDPEVAKKFSRLWTWYEFKITSMEAPDDLIFKVIDSSDEGGRGLALLETHYVANDWFLKKDQLWKNLGAMKGVPITLINGRYDMMTPPVTAYRLHKALPKSELKIVEGASHSTWDAKIAEQIKKSVEDYARKIKDGGL